MINRPLSYFRSRDLMHSLEAAISYPKHNSISQSTSLLAVDSVPLPPRRLTESKCTWQSDAQRVYVETRAFITRSQTRYSSRLSTFGFTIYRSIVINVQPLGTHKARETVDIDPSLPRPSTWQRQNLSVWRPRREYSPAFRDHTQTRAANHLVPCHTATRVLFD